ncbi:hypothetical protein PCG10_000066 [Penicillium crustosum]|uniref:Major facilitator superfamily (MFS) profile domain-containing protein n=1 Tax=Penicillium crustosum TaxID=36656 RepID=A0A9P5GW21_PENCR|nr:Major facilitator superfamily domain general substrate transporter [Penicillium crustosum]KAF7530557.1 hypothetical protein PCG10_000066 [Penicillium crustosum]KAJ5401744.1 Major facilitator superfamily domain general substrate transporter [Penicillium crustosum]
MVREATKTNRYDDSGNLKFFPEDRCPVGGPCVASMFFGLGMMLVMGTVQTAIMEFTPKKTSSGIAVANFVRNLLACTDAVVTQPMLDGIGNGWMCTLIGLVAFVTGISAILSLSLRFWGPPWRVLMDRKLNALKS